MGKIKNWKKYSYKNLTKWVNSVTHYIVQIDRHNNSVEILHPIDPGKDEYWYFKSYNDAYKYAIKRIKKQTRI